MILTSWRGGELVTAGRKCLRTGQKAKARDINVFCMGQKSLNTGQKGWDRKVGTERRSTHPCRQSRPYLSPNLAVKYLKFILNWNNLC